MGIVAPPMQHPSAGGRYGLFIKPNQLAAVDANSGLAINSLDGFSFGLGILRIVRKVCALPVFLDFNRNAVTTLIHRGFPPIPNRHIGVNCDVLILPESRSIPRL